MSTPKAYTSPKTKKKEVETPDKAPLAENNIKDQQFEDLKKKPDNKRKTSPSAAKSPGELTS